MRQKTLPGTPIHSGAGQFPLTGADILENFPTRCDFQGTPKDPELFDKY